MSMTRQECFNGIELRLSWLVTSIGQRGKLNILDLNIISENFFAHFLNLLYNWNLSNMNTVIQNETAFDLIDNENKIIVQVSSDSSKRKINSSLSKNNLLQYTGYNFKFIGITGNTQKLRLNTYLNPHNLQFNPQIDIYDMTSILKTINGMKNVEKIEEVFDFIRKEIKIPISQEKVETNIAAIIEIVSKTNLEEYYRPETIPFEIEKKISFNELIKSRAIIENYKQYSTCIDKIYTEFDRLGNNKSLSVLNNLKNIYLRNSDIKNPDDCFQTVIDDVTALIKQSANYTPIPEEEVSMYIGIIVVDAFMRCKIFKNPEAAINVTA
jgi:hypothetical protein